jgi:hypothetical protein
MRIHRLRRLDGVWRLGWCSALAIILAGKQATPLLVRNQFRICAICGSPFLDFRGLIEIVASDSGSRTEFSFQTEDILHVISTRRLFY